SKKPLSASAPEFKPATVKDASTISGKFKDLSVKSDDNINSGINFDAYEDIPVETSGENVPLPVNSFDEIDLGEGLNRNIR
ncbi:hypothetical protein, partial [Mycobacterium tuberculosis]|uniref:hypothetical protein n=1 Tax=Mycobacterium tuberculosis TaxID=1773 RepID=UPI00254E5D8B